VLRVLKKTKQVKKNATNRIFEPFDERKEASGKPTSIGGNGKWGM
jgi:hypothetical protein